MDRLNFDRLAQFFFRAGLGWLVRQLNDHVVVHLAHVGPFLHRPVPQCLPVKVVYVPHLDRS